MYALDRKLGKRPAKCSPNVRFAEPEMVAVASWDYLISMMMIPGPIATTVAAMNSMRRLKRKRSQGIPGGDSKSGRRQNGDS